MLIGYLKYFLYLLGCSYSRQEKGSAGYQAFPIKEVFNI
jgi:hypothetical protein